MKSIFTPFKPISPKNGMLLSCFLSLPMAMNATPDIIGKNNVMAGESATYTVDADSRITDYKWILPSGCFITSGKNSNRIELTASYMALDGDLKVVRTFDDDTTDESILPINIDRYIREFENHSIKEGETVDIAGTTIDKACIYYEDIVGTNQVKAHRVTYIPTSYVEMTKPYLQTATSDGIWISWKTNYNEPSSVSYGPKGGALTSVTTAVTEDLSSRTNAYYWHSAQITGLDANTGYSYRVKTGDRESEIYTFHTMPEEGSKTPLRILLMGDHQIKTRSGYEWLCEAARKKVEEKYGDFGSSIHMVMNDGDQVDVGTLEQYEHIHLYKSETLSPYVPIMTAVGNHETYSDTDMKR